MVVKYISGFEFTFRQEVCQQDGVAVKELKLSAHNSDTPLFTIHLFSGNLNIKVLDSNPEEWCAVRQDLRRYFEQRHREQLLKDPRPVCKETSGSGIVPVQCRGLNKQQY